MLKEGGYDEWDHLQVFATIRYHDKPHKGRKRTGQHVELWVHPTHVPRTDWADDPEAVGEVWTQEGKLFGNVFVPADTFYSLFPCLASNHFKELELRLLLNISLIPAPGASCFDSVLLNISISLAYLASVFLVRTGRFWQDILRVYVE